MMLQLPSNEAGPPPTTASYVDNAVCATPGCHDDVQATYVDTKHAVAFPDLMAGFHLPSCEPCHATGAPNATGVGVPSIYPVSGYDVSTHLPAYLQNVTCQSCHGPGSLHVASGANKQATIGLVLNSSLCGSCHYSEPGQSVQHHPTYNEWLESGHNTATLPSYVKNAACSNCHEVLNAMQFIESNGTVTKTVLRAPGEDAPLTWEIGCVVCHDPHDNSTQYQLRLPREQICAVCHNSQGAVPGKAVHHPMAEMRNNTAGYLADRTGLTYMSDIACYECHLSDNYAATPLPNHTFAPKADACRTCHGGSTFPTNESAQVYIDAVATMTNVGIESTSELVEQANALMLQMAGNRTGVNMVSTSNEYNISKFNLESVDSDSSQGNHNPMLASSLLKDARDRAGTIVSDLTPPGKLTGVYVVRNADGSVTVNWSASDASDFAKYRIYVLTAMSSNVTGDTWKAEVTNRSIQTYTLTDLDADTAYYVYVTAVDTKGNEITNTVSPATVAKLTAEEKGLTTLDYGLIGIVVVLALIAAALAMMLMRKGKGAKPTEIPVKTEE